MNRKASGPPDLTQRAYDIGLSAYRNYRWYSSPERMKMRATVRRWLGSRRPLGTLLEVGGGASVLRPLIEREIPEVRYISSDISPTNVTDVVLDGTKLPVRDGSVDVLMALEVLEHIPEPRTMIDEISRALVPGGMAILTTPFMFGVHDYRDYYRYTPLGMETLLSGSGLELAEVGLRGGTFLTAATLVRSMIRNKILGPPDGWRAQGMRKKLLWLLIVVLEVPFVPVMWLSLGVDRVIDRESHSPPGYFWRFEKPDPSVG